MRAVFEVMGVTDIVARASARATRTTWCAPRWTRLKKLDDAGRGCGQGGMSVEASSTDPRAEHRHVDKKTVTVKLVRAWPVPSSRTATPCAACGCASLNSESTLEEHPRSARP
jgi:hypothetical protein